MNRSTTVRLAFWPAQGFLCLSLAITAVVVGNAQADTVFCVSTSGNDAWSGTLATPNAQATDGPFASLARARDAIRQLKVRLGGLREPVHVQIRGGTYYLSATLTLGPEDSGTAQCSVVYEAYPGETPVLSGGRRITGWRPCQGKIQVANLPEVAAGTWRFRSLFVDGRREIRARYPNFDPADPARKGFLYAAGEPTSKANGPTTWFRYEQGTFKPSWATAPEAEIHIWPTGHSRAIKEIVSIASVDEATRTVNLRGKECVGSLGLGDRYFVENVFEELDSPGEWFLNSTTGELFYWPREPFSDRSAVVAPRLGRIIEALGTGRKGSPAEQGKAVFYVRISGLTFQQTDYTPEDGCGGFGCGNDGVVYLRDAVSCTVENCTFRQIGKYAIYLAGGADNAICGNDIQDGAEGGVFLHASARNIVRDNHIHHIGAVYKHIAGIMLQEQGTDDNIVDHNLIHDSSRYGISLKAAGNMSRNRIEYNRILNTNLETHDTGGIEVTQHQPNFLSHSIIRGNVVGDTIGYSANGPKAMFLSWGIYLDSLAGGYTVTENVVYRTANGGIMLQGGKENHVTNNIFVDGKFKQMDIRNWSGNSTGQVLERNIFAYDDPQAIVLWSPPELLKPGVIRIDRNLYWHAGGKLVFYGAVSSLAQWQGLGFDQNCLVADPRFVHPQHDNYALRDDSPAWKLGFNPIDANKAGLLRSRCRCEIRPAGPDYGF